MLPGNVAAEGLIDLGPDYGATMAASIPLRRLGTVDDIGNACLFLATEDGSRTGQDRRRRGPGGARVVQLPQQAGR